MASFPPRSVQACPGLTGHVTDSVFELLGIGMRSQNAIYRCMDAWCSGCSHCGLVPLGPPSLAGNDADPVATCCRHGKENKWKIIVEFSIFVWGAPQELQRRYSLSRSRAAKPWSILIKRPMREPIT